MRRCLSRRGSASETHTKYGGGVDRRCRAVVLDADGDEHARCSIECYIVQVEIHARTRRERELNKLQSVGLEGRSRSPAALLQRGPRNLVGLPSIAERERRREVVVTSTDARAAVFRGHGLSSCQHELHDTRAYTKTRPVSEKQQTMTLECLSARTRTCRAFSATVEIRCHLRAPSATEPRSRPRSAGPPARPPSAAGRARRPRPQSSDPRRGSQASQDRRSA